MLKIFTTLLSFLFLLSLNAQSIDEKVKELMVVEGTIRSIENLIQETINQQKQVNTTVSESFWLSLNADIQQEAVPNFIELTSPIYIESFSEEQIDQLIGFYSTKVGKYFVLKQPEFSAALSTPLTQWTQNLTAQIINKVENREDEVPTTNEIEKFEQDLKNELGLTVVNLSELTLDQDHNPGTLLIDFGEINDQRDITKEVIVRNNTDRLISFEKPLFLLSDDVAIDWGNTPLQPKEERAIKFTLNVDEAEGKKYLFTSLNTDQGQGLQFGIKYNAPKRELDYNISQKSLNFEAFDTEFSKEYDFILTNNGEKHFRISNVILDKSIAYVYFDQGMIDPNGKAVIKILFTKELTSNIQKLELNLKIELTKSDVGESLFFPDKTVTVKIK